MSHVLWCACACACLCVRHPVSLAKADEPIQMPFGEADSRGPNKPCIMAITYRRHLANTTERSVRGGGAALCQITLTTCVKCEIAQHMHFDDEAHGRHAHQSDPEML